jgi:hypothetical protein
MTTNIKPRVYLNRVIIKGVSYIKLYFFTTPNEHIISRIKSNSWINYNSELGAYIIVEKDNTVGLLIELFDDIAFVKEYLDYKKAEILLINRQKIGNIYEAVDLQKRKGLIHITLLPFVENSRAIIGVKHHFDKEAFYKLWNEDFIDYNKKKRLWYFDSSVSNIWRIYKLLANKYLIKISNSIDIVDIRLRQELLEQIYVKDIYYKSCPEKYLSYMQLHNYAWNTMITYHNMVLRFINSYRSFTISKST